MGIHDGHRERMKARFREHGAEQFEDHQLLELLLFYALPRQDVNPLAHALLDHFGSLDNLLEASAEELCQVPGVGSNTATLLLLIPQIDRRYQIRKHETRRQILTAEQAGHCLMPFFRYAREEQVYLMCLDSRRRVLCCKCMARGEADCANVSVRALVETALSRRAAGVVLAHNHTSYVALPSADDLATTRQLKIALEAVNIRLLDHLIIAGDDFVSLADSGELEE